MGKNNEGTISTGNAEATRSNGVAGGLVGGASTRWR